MKIEFERPDYCQGCMKADYSLNTTKMYANMNELCEMQHSIECAHDAACKRMHDMTKESESKE